jgi:N-formylglutamate deformylase
MIVHIPHSSRIIPENLRGQIVLSEQELSLELTRMTDAFTDELFSFPDAVAVTFPLSRLIVDVERFPDDADEPMAKMGMGMIYTKSAHGKKLRRTLLPNERKQLVTTYYEPHHQALFEKVQTELDSTGKSLIVDCHSFPSIPLPCDIDQSNPRPDFCVGTDPFHTPGDLIELTTQVIGKMGFNVEIDRPYLGSLVPKALYRKDKRVASIMIEVNRKLYMDELSGKKTAAFDQIREHIQIILKMIKEFHNQSWLVAKGE